MCVHDAAGCPASCTTADDGFAGITSSSSNGPTRSSGGEHPLIDPHLHDDPTLRLEAGHGDPPAVATLYLTPAQQERGLPPVRTVVPTVADLGGAWWEWLGQCIGPVRGSLAVHVRSAMSGLSSAGVLHALSQRLAPLPESFRLPCGEATQKR